MDTLGKTSLWSFCDRSAHAKLVKTGTTVRTAPGHPVRSFLELATKVAELQFRNREHVLMFRGQSADHRNTKDNTTLKPSLFRSKRGSRLPPLPGTLTARFIQLKSAEVELVRQYEAAGMLGIARLKRHQILRWAILQHYEVCPTPLLDVTHSLRISASFASQGGNGDAFLFVLAIPNLGGAITASAEAGLQILRLASVCPPSAVRPHLQEGYLLGEYPEMTNYDQKELYHHYEIDFGRRLLAKFRFNPKSFWKDDSFPQVGKEALYPSPNVDPLCRLAEKVKSTLKPV